MERQLGNSKRQRFVEIHILHIATYVKEVITLPVGGQCGQAGITKFRIDLVTASEDNVLVIDTPQQGCYGAVTGIASTRPLEGAGQTDALIIVCNISRSVTVDLFGIAAKYGAGGIEWEFRLAH